MIECMLQLSIRGQGIRQVGIWGMLLMTWTVLTSMAPPLQQSSLLTDCPPLTRSRMACWQLLGCGTRWDLQKWRASADVAPCTDGKLLGQRRLPSERTNPVGCLTLSACGADVTAPPRNYVGAGTPQLWQQDILLRIPSIWLLWRTAVSPVVGPEDDRVLPRVKVDGHMHGREEVGGRHETEGEADESQTGRWVDVDPHETLHQMPRHKVAA